MKQMTIFNLSIIQYVVLNIYRPVILIEFIFECEVDIRDWYFDGLSGLSFALSNK
jgi:hypothetical protein